MNNESNNEFDLNDLLNHPEKDVIGNPGDADFIHAHQLIDIVKETMEEFGIAHPKLTNTVNNIIHSFNASGL